MGQDQSAKAGSEEAPDRLQIYKWLVDLAFLGAQLQKAPELLDLLKMIRDGTEIADLPFQPLDPWPKGEMNPHEAMQELERAVEIDDLENVRLVGIPGVPPERYSSSGPFAYLAHPEAKSLPRDSAYRNAYKFAVDRYLIIYFGPSKKGRPRLNEQYLAKLVELRERGLSYGQIRDKLGLPSESVEDRQQSADLIRHQLKTAKKLHPRIDASQDPIVRLLRACLMCLEHAPPRTMRK